MGSRRYIGRAGTWGEIMFFGLGSVVLAIAGLLAVLGTLSGGRLQIDNVCDIRRQEKPVTFFLIVIFATVVFGGLQVATGWPLWDMLTTGTE